MFARIASQRLSFHSASNVNRSRFPKDCKKVGKTEPPTNNWLEALEPRVLLSGETLDQTFGNDGLASAFGGVYSQIVGLAVLPNGKILAAGQVDDNPGKIALAEFNPDGSLNTSFGIGGTVTTSVGGYDGITVRAMLVQSDGKIVVAGTDDESYGAVPELILARYNPNGSLDTTFGQGGISLTVVSSDNYSTPVSLAEQPDGKLLVAGGAQGFCIERYNANGTLDDSFGTDGIAGFIPSDPAQGAAALGVVVQPDGTLTAYGASVGWVDGHISSLGDEVVRFSSTGTVLSEETTPINYQQGLQQTFAAAPDGKAVMLGRYLNAFNADGSPDSAFQSTDTFASLGDDEEFVAVRSDGYIFVVSAWDYTLAAYNPNGTLDTSFGDNGVATLPDPSLYQFPDYIENADAIAFESNGDILVGGAGFYLIRYTAATDASASSPLPNSPNFRPILNATQFNQQAPAPSSDAASFIATTDQLSGVILPKRQSDAWLDE